jgi:CheY-like chemotaxis protein
MPAKILVVDDEPDLEPLLCQVFRKKIRQKQFQLIFAHDGLEALEKLQAEPGYRYSFNRYLYAGNGWANFTY